MNPAVCDEVEFSPSRWHKCFDFQVVAAPRNNAHDEWQRPQQIIPRRRIHPNIGDDRAFQLTDRRFRQSREIAAFWPIQP
jgi:hypothetical protein